MFMSYESYIDFAWSILFLRIPLIIEIPGNYFCKLGHVQTHPIVSRKSGALIMILIESTYRMLIF